MKKSRFGLVVLVAVTVALSTVMMTSPGSAAPSPAKADGGHRSHHRTSTLPLPPDRQAAFQRSLRQKLSALQSASAKQPRVAHLAANLNKAAGVPGALDSPEVPVAKDGTVEVTVQGSGALAAAAAVGARVVSHFGEATTIQVKSASLRALAARPGVTKVAKPVRAVPQVSPGLISQGVIASGAQNWTDNSIGNGGVGVKIAVVDAGFGSLANEISAGHLPASKVVYTKTTNPTDPTNQNHCGSSGGDSVSDTDHGTAVAEIVHQMAPQATIYLYCVVDNVGFSQAASQIVAAGNIQIATSSLGFTAETRGDGTGGVGTTEAAVKSARDAGVLWIQSAGNSAQDHWSGNLVDANNDHFVDLLSPYDEADVTALDPGTSGTVVLSWDDWPGSSLPILLDVEEFDRPVSDGGTGALLSSVSVAHSAGDAPTLEVDIVNNSTKSGDYHIYEVFIEISTPAPTVHYDLFYGGDVYPTYLSGLNPARAAAGSVLEPATSGSALAVGASNWRTNALEPFSSRGPTIDGRVKPDLLGFDGTASNIFDVQSNPSDRVPADPSQLGFYGTSAAAPHVAGAAALLLAANLATSPATPMTASDIETQLITRASPRVNPPTNAAGNGLLQLANLSAGSCPARAALPAKVAIDRPDVAIAVPIATSCSAYVATAGLTGPKGMFSDLFWTATAPSQVVHFMARTDTPGTYSTIFRGGVADQGKVSWTATAMTAKYATVDSIASSRVGRAVYINGLLKNYTNTAAGMVHPKGRLLYLQRYYKGGWQTMLSRPVDANGRFVVGFIQSTVFQYRLVAVETPTIWGNPTVSTFR